MGPIWLKGENVGSLTIRRVGPECHSSIIFHSCQIALMRASLGGQSRVTLDSSSVSPCDLAFKPPFIVGLISGLPLRVRPYQKAENGSSTRRVIDVPKDISLFLSLSLSPSPCLWSGHVGEAPILCHTPHPNNVLPIYT